MYASTKYVKPSKADIGAIKPAWNGRMIEVNGSVTEFSVSEDGHAFMALKDRTGEITVVDFDTKLEDTPDNAVITSQVSIYNGNMEIIADEVRLRN